MPYLIDGNNLAGKLGILKEPDWDQTLILILQNYIERMQKKAIVVFDSADPLGDRYSEGDITIIYTPRDAVYDNADDKIMELMNNEKRPEDWVVITDDVKILDEADKLDIKTILATDFAKKLMPSEKLDSDELLDEEEVGILSNEDRQDITDEMMEEWG